MGDTSRTNKDHSVGFVIFGDVVYEIGTLDGKDVFLRAENCTTKRLALEGGCVKVVKDDLFELTVDFLLFADNDLSFTLDGTFFQFGALDDIRENFHGFGSIVFKRFGVVDGVFTLLVEGLVFFFLAIEEEAQLQMSPYRCISVQMSTHILNIQFELLLCALVGSLEGKMLEEVSDTVRPVSLGPATGVYPYSASRCLRIWRVLSCDLCRSSRQYQ